MLMSVLVPRMRFTGMWHFRREKREGRCGGCGSFRWLLVPETMECGDCVTALTRRGAASAPRSCTRVVRRTLAGSAGSESGDKVPALQTAGGPQRYMTCADTEDRSSGADSTDAGFPGYSGNQPRTGPVGRRTLKSSSPGP